MSKIITNKKIYTTRNNEECLVLIEINDFNEKKDKGGFTAIVTDRAVKYVEVAAEEDGGDPTMELKEIAVLQRAPTFYPYAQIDYLFSAIGDPIEGSESFSDELDLLQARALLLVTQGAPIYGTEAGDWEILNTPE